MPTASALVPVEAAGTDPWDETSPVEVTWRGVAVPARYRREVYTQARAESLADAFAQDTLVGFDALCALLLEALAGWDIWRGDALVPITARSIAGLPMSLLEAIWSAIDADSKVLAGEIRQLGMWMELDGRGGKPPAWYTKWALAEILGVPPGQVAHQPRRLIEEALAVLNVRGAIARDRQNRAEAAANARGR